MNGVALIWSKDMREMLFSRKATLSLVLGTLLYSLASYLILTNTGITLLTQAEALWAFSKTAILVGLLVVLVESSASLASEFESGTADLLLVAPLSLRELVLAKVGVALTLWAALYLVSIPYVIVIATGTGATFACLAYSAVVGTLAVGALALPVTALGLAFRSVRNTLVTSLLVLLAFAVPAFFAGTLSAGGVGTVLKRLDPVQNAFAILDNVIVDNNFSVGSNAGDLTSLVVFFLGSCVVLAVVVLHIERTGPVPPAGP